MFLRKHVRYSLKKQYHKLCKWHKMAQRMPYPFPRSISTSILCNMLTKLATILYESKCYHKARKH